MKKFLSAICMIALLSVTASAGAPRYAPGGAWGNTSDLISGLTRVETTVIPATQLKGANSSPQTIIPAPGAGLVIVVDNIVAWYDFNSTAYNGIAGGEDLAIGYEDENGTQLGEIEMTGFVDQATSQYRIMTPHSAASGSDTSLPVLANKAIVAYMLSGEIATGNSALRLKIYYHVVPTAW